MTSSRPTSELDQSKLAAAVTEAGAAEVTGGLADGYDTLLDRRFEGGHDRAGGQTVLLITYAELMRLGGRYAQLYELQASAYGQAWQVSGLPPL